MRNALTIIAIVLAFSLGVLVSPSTKAVVHDSTVTDSEFIGWNQSLTTQQQDDLLERYFAVTDSFISNTGLAGRLLVHIEEHDPTATASFVNARCGQH